MTDYIKALRLPIVFLAGLLCCVSYKISEAGELPILPIIFTVFLAGTCMVQNDWRDRKHDVRKGKFFASNNERPFLIYLLILWLVTAGLAIGLWQKQAELGYFALAYIFCGLIYSETRKMPFLPAFLVAIVSASPVLFPAVSFRSQAPVLLFLSTSLLIFGREILKDLDDMRCDKGYKWTLPVSLGQKKSKLIAGLFILSASATSLILSLKTFPGVLFLLAASAILLANEKHSIAKRLIDIGILLTLVSLYIFSL